MAVICGHAGAGDDAGGADRTGADADLQAVDAQRQQVAGRGGGGDVAHDQVDIAGHAPDLLDGPHDLERVGVRGVDDDGVDLGVDQGLDPFQGVLGGAYPGAHAQLALGVLGGGGELFRFDDVLEGDQPFQEIIFVDDGQLFDAVDVQELLGFGHGDALAGGDQPLGFHDGRDLVAEIAGEAQVAVGQDAHQPPLRVDDGQAGDPLFPDQLQGFLDRVVRAQRDRVDDHARFRALDPEDLARLFLDGEVLVDDGHAAQLGHGDGHARFGDGVHGRRHQRDAQADAPGKRGGGVGLGGEDLRIARDQQHVIEGQAMLAYDLVVCLHFLFLCLPPGILNAGADILGFLLLRQSSISASLTGRNRNRKRRTSSSMRFRSASYMS